jgi:oxygen-dependent protoporphyrinogen oxidase
VSGAAPRGAQPSVLVVGAGLAGLAAAHRLERAGARVTVLEAAERPCAWTAPVAVGGAAIEPDLVTVPAAAAELRRLAAELGVAERVHVEQIRRVAIGRQGDLRAVDLERAGRVGGLPGVPPWESLRLRRVRRIADWFGDKLDPDEPEQAVRLDDRSVADFARLYAGPRIHERMLRPMFELHFGLDSESASRVLLLLLLRDGGVPALARVRGLDALAGALAARIRDLRTGVRVERLSAGAAGVSTDSGLEADAAVLAVAPGEVARILAARSPFEDLYFTTRRAAQRIALVVALDPPPELPAPIVWTPGVEKGLLAGIAAADSGAGPARALLLVGRRALASAFEASDDLGATEALLRGGEEWLPGLRARVRDARLVRHSVPDGVFDVGGLRATARLGDEERTQAHERPVFFAGAYRIGPHVEGALVSGRRAAERVLESS